MLILALISASCSEGSKSSLNNKTNITSELSNRTTEKGDRSSGIKAKNYSSKIIRYKITKAHYIRKDIEIYYPQIINLGNINKQKSINKLIKEQALMDVTHENAVELSFMEMNYNIKWKSENLLSIEFLGLNYYKGCAHPNNLISTVNIDIKKARVLKLKDFVNIDNNLVVEFKLGKYKQWDRNLNLEDRVNDIRNEDTNEELIEDFNHADSPKSGYGIFSYFTKDSLGISKSISHAIGDHVEFEIRYQDIVNNLKTENELWNDFNITNKVKS